MFIHGQNQRNLIEVSGDGMLQCKNGENCNQNHPRDWRIAVEAKCLYPVKNFLNSHCTKCPHVMFHKHFVKWL